MDYFNGASSAASSKVAGPYFCDQFTQFGQK